MEQEIKLKLMRADPEIKGRYKQALEDIGHLVKYACDVNDVEHMKQTLQEITEISLKGSF